LNWMPPDTGIASQYKISRCAAISGTTCTPTFFTSVAGTVTTFSDMVSTTNPYESGAACQNGNTCYNTTYFYFVQATVTVNGISGDSPAYNTVSGQIPHQFVIGNITPQSVQYGTANPNITATIYGSGSLTTSQVTCAYYSGATPVPTPQNAGTYNIVCSPVTLPAPATVSFNVAYLTYTPGTLTITPMPITLTAATSSKPYNGTNTSTVVPTRTGPAALPYGDVLTLSETYDNPNVGTTHVMTPSAIPGNGTTLLSNYTFNPPVTVNTGVITPAPLTITANSATKTYGQTVTFAGTEFTITPPTTYTVRTR